MISLDLSTYISRVICVSRRETVIQFLRGVLHVCVTNAIKGLANLFASPIWSYHSPPCCRASWYGRVKVERHRPPSVSLRTVGLWTKVKWVPTQPVDLWLTVHLPLIVFVRGRNLNQRVTAAVLLLIQITNENWRYEQRMDGCSCAKVWISSDKACYQHLTAHALYT